MDLEVVDSIWIINSSAVDNSDERLEVDDSGSIHVVGGHYSHNGGDGIDIDNTLEISVAQVVARGNGGNGMQVEAGNEGNSDIDVISSVSVANSLFEDNGENGIEIIEGFFPANTPPSKDGLINRVRLTHVASLGNALKGFHIDVSGELIAHGNMAQGNGDDTLP
jgi:hypothetical protein